jgi:carbamoyl-phosphate synthase small subunit
MVEKLILADGSSYEGISYGSNISVAGEVVFATGMMGYPESITDPSYKGQILILTYPLIGNYGIPDQSLWESDNVMVSGLIVSNYIDTPSHFQSQQTLKSWFKDSHVPLIEIKDTRALTQKIREYGVMLGKIIFTDNLPFYDPNNDNLVAQVSTKKITIQKSAIKAKTILLIDCGTKRNIQKALIKRGVNVITVPWDFNPFTPKNKAELSKLLNSSVMPFDAILISNGPGDPKSVKQTIITVKTALDLKIPVLGICLGHQVLALAAGGNTQKLKYGHRSQNQPCSMVGSHRCYITTQNHGFAVSKIPAGFNEWFINANDGSNEGIIHRKLPFMSVQFHPEATPGPEDAEWIFDYFIEKIKKL